MYENHPYKRKVIGTPDIISRISRDEIMDYYKTFYTPQNVSTIVVGDFDEEKVLEKIIKEFQFKNTKEAPKVQNVMETTIKNPEVITQYGEVNSGYIMFGFLADSAKNLKESIALDIISTILGEGKSSRLYVNLIEKMAEPYYFSLDTCHYQFKEGNNFFIEANFDHTKFDKVIPEIKNELKNIQNITEDELKKAKKQTKVGFASSTETVAKLGDSIGHYLTVCEDLNMAQNYEKLLEEIDTQYIQEIAKKYLDPEKCAINVLLPNEEK
jgi:zinc protease